MPYPHHTMSHPTDPHPVRPGTSAALTARTIDDTIHPPLVRAQETVAEFVPRLAAPLSSPLLLASLLGTLVFWWVARRARFQPSGILLSAALLVTLSSFRPVGDIDGPNTIAPPASEPEVYERFETPQFETPRFETPSYTPRVSEPSPYDFETPEPPQPPPVPHVVWQVRIPPGARGLAPKLIEAYPALVIATEISAQKFVHDERQLRAYVRDLNRRLRAETRRRARDWEKMSDEYARR